MDSQSYSSSSNSPNLVKEFDRIEKNIPMSPALLNPVVLDVIFAQLNIPDLKSCRLVCRQWCEIGTSLLGKRTSLSLNELFRAGRTSLSQSAPVDDKLLRRVAISSKNFDISVPTKKRTDVIVKAISSVDEHLTSEMHIYLDQKNYVTPVLQGMWRLASTKIQHVTLYVDTLESWGDKAPPMANGKLPVRTTLTSLKFDHSMDRFQLGRHHIPHSHQAVQPFLQIWLDSAPNLTTLHVTTNFCPNLAGCKNLKDFSFLFKHTVRVPQGGLDLAAVTEMLTQIKDSVVKVELGFQIDYNALLPPVPPVRGQLDLPVLPNVVSLVADDIYEIIDSVDEQSLPKLKHLSVEKHFLKKAMSNSPPSPRHHWNMHRGIQSVTLIIRVDLFPNYDNFSEMMVKSFPNVKRFDLSCQLNYTKLLPHHFIGFLDPFKLWGLERVKVQLGVANSAMYVVYVLRKMSTWRGTKTAKFRLEVSNTEITVDIGKFIICTGEFRIVEIMAPLDFKCIQALQSMVENRGAPIMFKRWSFD